MAAGMSIHIGLNFVDPNAYNGWNGQLSGCINDANSMKAIADSLGYQSCRLIDAGATSHAVVAAIGGAALALRSGDILFLTYSGHGGQVNDVNGEEADGMDETWCLWDRQMIDDELYSLWSQFVPGVRIVVLSDSCHSGTILKMVANRECYQAVNKTRAEPTFRLMPPDRQREDNELRRDTYASAQWTAGPSERATVSASVLLISGCQDNQLSSDGAVNGLFTEKLLNVWSNGSFNGDYGKFWRDICNFMPPNQSPNYFTVGVSNPVFEAEKPFTIGAGSGGGGGPVPVTPTTTRPTLRRPASGSDVQYMQQRLVAHGFQVSVDGIFGPGTEAQVMSFQRANSLSADGVVGPMTWQALDRAPAGSSPSQPSVTPSQPTTPSGTSRPTLRKGSRGEDVRYLQQLLQNDGFFVTVDADFGPQTESAVRSFQSSNGLQADGVVGPATWQALERRGIDSRAAVEFAKAY